MEQKTRREILISLHNDQLEKVLNREVSVRMLEELMKKDPERVLAITPDLDAMMPKKVTVRMRLNEMYENLELDQQRLKHLVKMIEEEAQ